MSKIKQTIRSFPLSWTEDESIANRHEGRHPALPTVHWNIEKGGSGDWSVWRTAFPHNPMTTRVGVGPDFAMARAIAEIDAGRAFEIRCDAQMSETQNAALGLVEEAAKLDRLNQGSPMTAGEVAHAARVLAQYSSRLAEDAAIGRGVDLAVLLLDLLATATDVHSDRDLTE